MTTGPGLAASLAYVSGWIGGIIVLATEKHHRELRYHAAQSILLDVAIFTLAFFGWGLGFALLAASGLLSNDGSGAAVGGLVLLVLGGLYGLLMIGYLVAKILCAVRSFRLQHIRVPLVGHLAERWVGTR